MVEELAGLIGLGIFGFFSLGIMLISLLELAGKIYATYHSLNRNDLTNEQLLIFIVSFWFIPFAWIIYLLMGRERTADLFSDLDFL